MAAQPPDIIILQQPVQPNKKYIKVNHPGIEKVEGTTIEFKNNLPGEPEARLTFYELGDKGGTAIAGFCDGNPGTYFPVPGTGNGKATCTVAKVNGMDREGNFAYSIEADGYVDLDPIIIIEPSKFQSAPSGQQGAKAYTSAIVGALLGAAIMFVLMKTVFGKGNQAS